MMPAPYSGGRFCSIATNLRAFQRRLSNSLSARQKKSVPHRRNTPEARVRLLNAGGCRLGNQNERIAERATPAENLTENPPKKLLGGRTFAQTRVLCGDPNMLQIPFHSLRMRPNKARIFHKMPQSTQKNLPTAFRQNKVCKLRANQPASPKTLPALLQAPTTATPSPE